MSKPRYEADGTSCPLLGKLREKVCHTCAWYTHVRGKHPQTNADVDHWECAMAMMPMLMIENAMVGRQTTATVDALRAEVGRGNDQAMVGAISHLNGKLHEARSIAAGVSPRQLLEG